jgi:hypothetical protein
MAGARAQPVRPGGHATHLNRYPTGQYGKSIENLIYAQTLVMILLGNVALISQHVPVLAQKVINFTNDRAAKTRYVQ